MPRQTITLTEPNHAWLQARVDSGEYRTHTEAVNDALRRMREKEQEIAFLEKRLADVAQNGTVTQSPEEMLAEIKAGLKREGTL